MKPSLTVDLFRCAVYGLRRGDEYIYIGQSTTPIIRIHHLRRLLLPPNDKIDIWYCPESELDSLERALIQRFNPKFNVQKWAEPKFRFVGKKFDRPPTNNEILEVMKRYKLK